MRDSRYVSRDAGNGDAKLYSKFLTKFVRQAMDFDTFAKCQLADL